MFQDLRYALRTFVRAPAFALIAVATLALGIGANTAIFSVVDAVLLRPLAYPDSDAIMYIQQTRPRGGAGNWSYPDLADIRGQARSFSDLAAYHGDAVILTGQGEPARLDAMTTSANFFRLLQVTPALGRGFAPDEDQVGKNRVALLTNATWHKRFAADPAVVGRTVTFDDTPYIVIGVLPPDFTFADIGRGDPEVFMPIPRPFDTGLMASRTAHYLTAIARLAPGTTPAQAQADVSTIAARLSVMYPDADAERGVRIAPLHQELVKELRPALLLLLGAVGFVLLIACANVANILLARATVRERELAIRFALGASRGRVLRQLLTESVVLAVVGGALGVVLALWSLDALRSVLPEDLLRIHALGIDGRVLGFTAAVSIATGLVFGLLPALHATAGSPSDALQEGGRGSASGTHARARNVLVAAEIAVALLLLVGAGVTLRSFLNLSHTDPGFNPRDLITSEVALPDARYAENAKVAAFYRALKERVASLPGVQAAALGIGLPFSAANISLRFTVVGQPAPAPGHDNVATFRAVNADYFKTLEIPVLHGRTFTDVEDRLKGPPVLVISQTFARRYFPNGDAVGQHLAVGFQELKEPLEVIGIVGDTRGEGLDQEPQPEMYAPFAATTFPYIQIAARTTASVGFASALKAQVAAIDAEQPLGEVKTMTASIGDSMAKERLSALLLGIFGAVALALALIGVYGVMSYTVTQRRHEIGIRMALGARPGDVTRMVVRRGLTLAAIGGAVGIVGALALGRLMSGMLFGVSAADPITFVVTFALLVGVAALASWLPARRAAKVDPMVALRIP
jgi:putative ABC transport system permease protein